MRELPPEYEALARQHGVDVERWQSLTERLPSPEWIRHARVRVVPPPWRVVSLAEDGGAYTDGVLNVMTSVAREADGLHWLHVSCTRKDGQLPTYSDLVRMKALFVGSYRKAIQVFPPTTEHVNIHPTCLHLFACLEADPLPDFTGGVGSI